VLSAEALDEIRQATAGGEPVERPHRVQLTAGDGTVHAEIEWLIHIRRRDTTKEG
jgi:hypothetical protein